MNKIFDLLSLPKILRSSNEADYTSKKITIKQSHRLVENIFKIVKIFFIIKIMNLEKLLISLVFLFPLMLSISIFVADLFASLSDNASFTGALGFLQLDAENQERH